MDSRQFLNNIKIKSDLDNTYQSELAIKVIFSVLSDCLSNNDSNRIKAQLPKELHSCWHKNILSRFLQSIETRKKRKTQVFQKLRNILPNKNPKIVTWAIFDTLKDQITIEAADNVSSHLSEDLQQLWQTTSILTRTTKREQTFHSSKTRM